MYFILGTGRCGTFSLAKTLSEQTNSVCLHEPEPELVAEASQYRYGDLTGEHIRRILLQTRSPDINGKSYGEANQNLSLILPCLESSFPHAKYIWLIRNGLEVVASYVGRRTFTGHITSSGSESVRTEAQRRWIEGRIEGDRCGDVSSEQWSLMDSFSKCCWYWSYVNRVIAQDIRVFAGTDQFRRVQLEQLDKKMPEMINWLGLKSDAPIQLCHFNKAHYMPYHHNQWTDAEKHIFLYWCGSQMDQYYPGWREQTGGIFLEQSTWMSAGERPKNTNYFANPQSFEAEFSVESLNNEGEALYAKGDFSGAKQKFQQAFEMNPHDATTSNNLGAIFWEEGEPVHALRYFTLALGQDAEKQEVVVNCIRVLQALSRFQEAGELCRYYENRFGKDDTLHQLELGQKSIAPVIDTHQIQESNQARNKNADELVNEGEKLYAEGDLEAAKNRFHLVLQDDPTHLEARNNLGAVYWQLGQRDDALKQFSTALKQDPNCREALINIVQVLELAGEIDRAIRYCKQFLSLSPNDTEIIELKKILGQKNGPAGKEVPVNLSSNIERLIVKGEQLFQQGEYTEAEKLFLEVLEQQPANTDALNNLGALAWQRNDNNEAITYFTKALQYDPMHREAIENCIRALDAVGMIGEALRLCDRFLFQVPNDQEMLKIQRQLRQKAASVA